MTSDFQRIKHRLCCLNDEIDAIRALLPVNPPPIPLGRGPNTISPAAGIVDGVTRAVSRLVDGVNQPVNIVNHNVVPGTVIGPSPQVPWSQFRGWAKSNSSGVNRHEYNIVITDPDPDQYLVFELYNATSPSLPNRDIRVEFSRNPIRVQSNAIQTVIDGEFSYKFPTPPTVLPDTPFVFLPGPLTIRVWSDSTPPVNNTQLVWNFWNLQTPPP